MEGRKAEEARLHEGSLPAAKVCSMLYLIPELQEQYLRSWRRTPSLSNQIPPLYSDSTSILLSNHVTLTQIILYIPDSYLKTMT